MSDEDFTSACAWMSTSPAAGGLPNETKLELYGTYKFISTGAGPTGARPGMFSFEGRAKYDAWLRAAQTYASKEAARSRYVEIAEATGWQRGVEAVSVDDGTGSRERGTGLGVSVSVVAQDEASDSAQSPVHDAAGRGDVDALRILLIDSTLLNAKDEFGYTPLHVATDRGRKEAVQYLVSQGADKTIRDQDGQTALDVANLLSNEDIAALLQ